MRRIVFATSIITRGARVSPEAQFLLLKIEILVELEDDAVDLNGGRGSHDATIAWESPSKAGSGFSPISSWTRPTTCCDTPSPIPSKGGGGWWPSWTRRTVLPTWGIPCQNRGIPCQNLTPIQQTLGEPDFGWK